MIPLPERSARCRYPMLPDGTRSKDLEVCPAKLVGAEVQQVSDERVWLDDLGQIVYFEIGMRPMSRRLGHATPLPAIKAIDRATGCLYLAAPGDVRAGDELATWVQDGEWRPAIIVDGVVQDPEGP